MLVINWTDGWRESVESDPGKHFNQAAKKSDNLRPSISSDGRVLGVVDDGSRTQDKGRRVVVHDVQPEVVRVDFKVCRVHRVDDDRDNARNDQKQQRDGVGGEVDHGLAADGRCDGHRLHLVHLVFSVAVDLDPDAAKRVEQEAEQKQVVDGCVRLYRFSGQYHRKLTEADEEVVRIFSRKQHVDDLRE